MTLIPHPVDLACAIFDKKRLVYAPAVVNMDCAA